MSKTKKPSKADTKRRARNVAIPLNAAEITAIGQWALHQTHNCIIEGLWARVEAAQYQPSKRTISRRRARAADAMLAVREGGQP